VSVETAEAGVPQANAYAMIGRRAAGAGRDGVPADRIKVKVEKSVVTLTGEVDWQFQKTEAGPTTSCTS
jgi:hypothetical protein